jgi:hypothetical protein
MTQDPHAGQYPVRPPWPQYDPDAHVRRLDQGMPPQDYGQRTWPAPQQPGWQQQPPQYPPPGPGHRQPSRKRGGKGKVIAGIIGGLVVVVIIIAAAASGGGKGSPAASSSSGTAAVSAPAPASSPAAKAAAVSTLTYVVTGSPADVTYGPAGSSLSGHSGMTKTAKLGNAVYYSVDAQLSGSGSVTCEIKVNGKVVSKSTATGGYNIASCEISKDPFSGKWTDTNAA